MGRTVRTASPRVGASAIVAFLAIGLLLAGGFGLMGGRNDASPKPSQVAAGAASPGSTPTLTPGPPTIPPIETEVEPSTPCSPPSDEPPEVRLEVASTGHLGQLEVVWTESGSPAPSVPAGAAYPITIPAFRAPSIWIVGARCALSWTLELNGEPFEVYVNARRDPRVGSQNRFHVSNVGRYGGQERVELRATLSLETMTAVVTWILAVEPWPRPAVTLRSSLGEVAMSPSCAVEFQLPLGVPDVDGCDREVTSPPTKVLQVASGETLEVEIPGWHIDPDFSIECGSLVDGWLEGDGSCDAYHGISGSVITSTGPEEGQHLLRMSFCGSPESIGNGEPVCLDWFANVEVRPGQ